MARHSRNVLWVGPALPSVSEQAFSKIHVQELHLQVMECKGGKLWLGSTRPLDLDGFALCDSSLLACCLSHYGSKALSVLLQYCPRDNKSIYFLTPPPKVWVWWHHTTISHGGNRGVFYGTTHRTLGRLPLDSRFLTTAHGWIFLVGLLTIPYPQPQQSETSWAGGLQPPFNRSKLFALNLFMRIEWHKIKWSQRKGSVSWRHLRLNWSCS